MIHCSAAAMLLNGPSFFWSSTAIQYFLVFFIVLLYFKYSTHGFNGGSITSTHQRFLHTRFGIWTTPRYNRILMAAGLMRRFLAESSIHVLIFIRLEARILPAASFRPPWH